MLHRFPKRRGNLGEREREERRTDCSNVCEKFQFPFDKDSRVVWDFIHSV